MKDNKRKDRGNIEIKREFSIGPHLKIPSNFNNLLKISSFKSSFLNYFMNIFHIFCDKRERVLLLC